MGECVDIGLGPDSIEGSAIIAKWEVVYVLKFLTLEWSRLFFSALMEDWF